MEREELYVLLAALESHLLRRVTTTTTVSSGTFLDQASETVTHHLVLADSALETQDDLLGGLSLLVEDGLGLSSVSCEPTTRISSTSIVQSKSLNEPDCFRS
jgi:hypothetical protein